MYKAMKGVETVAVKVCGMLLNEVDQVRSSMGCRRSCGSTPPAEASGRPAILRNTNPSLLNVQEALQREVAILKACRNRNIVAFLGEYVDTERTWLIMEYMEVLF